MSNSPETSGLLYRVGGHLVTEAIAPQRCDPPQIICVRLYYLLLSIVMYE